jgi:hypothetical protein
LAGASRAKKPHRNAFRGYGSLAITVGLSFRRTDWTLEVKSSSLTCKHELCAMGMDGTKPRHINYPIWGNGMGLLAFVFLFSFRGVNGASPAVSRILEVGSNRL